MSEFLPVRLGRDSNGSVSGIDELVPGEHQFPSAAIPYHLPIYNASALWGSPVFSGSPTTGDVLRWDGSKWEPSTLNIPSSTGDAITLRGVAICTDVGTPTVGEILIFDGTEWCTSTIPVEGNVSSTGGITAGRLVKWNGTNVVQDAGFSETAARFNASAIATRPVVSLAQGDILFVNGTDISGGPSSIFIPAPASQSTSDVLSWNGSQWVARAEGAAATDANATSIGGIEIDVGAPADGEVLKYDQGLGVILWAPDNTGGGGGDANASSVSGLTLVSFDQGDLLFVNGTNLSGGPSSLFLPAPGAITTGDILRWNGTTIEGTGFDEADGRFNASALSGLALAGLDAGDLLFVIGSNVSGGPSSLFVANPTSKSSGDILEWNGSTWIARSNNVIYTGAISPGDIVRWNAAGIAEDAGFNESSRRWNASAVSGLTLVGFDQGDLLFVNGANLSGGPSSLFVASPTSPTLGDVIKWNGSQWIASADDTGAGGTVDGTGNAGEFTRWADSNTIESTGFDEADSRFNASAIATRPVVSIADGDLLFVVNSQISGGPSSIFVPAPTGITPGDFISYDGTNITAKGFDETDSRFNASSIANRPVISLAQGDLLFVNGTDISGGPSSLFIPATTGITPGDFVSYDGTNITSKGFDETDGRFNASALGGFSLAGLDDGDVLFVKGSNVSGGPSSLFVARPTGITNGDFTTYDGTNIVTKGFDETDSRFNASSIANRPVISLAQGDLLFVNGTDISGGPSSLFIPAPASPSIGQVLKYDGAGWIASTDDTGGGGGQSDASSVSGLLLTSFDQGDVLFVNGTNLSGGPSSLFVRAPTSQSTSDVLAWNGSQWVGQSNNVIHTGAAISQGNILRWNAAGIVEDAGFKETSHRFSASALSGIPVLFGVKPAAQRPLVWSGTGIGTILPGFTADLMNVPIEDTPAVDGDILAYNEDSAAWKIVPSSTIAGAGGSNATQLQGSSISTAVATPGQVLAWSSTGGAWAASTINHPVQAPSTASFIVLALDSQLSQDRLFSAGPGVDYLDTGPKGTLTVSARHTSAIWNASSIQGRNVSSVAPTDGQVLKYSTGLNAWVPSTDNTGGGGGDLQDAYDLGNAITITEGRPVKIGGLDFDISGTNGYAWVSGNSTAPSGVVYFVSGGLPLTVSTPHESTDYGSSNPIFKIVTPSGTINFSNQIWGIFTESTGEDEYQQKRMNFKKASIDSSGGAGVGQSYARFFNNIAGTQGGNAAVCQDSSGNTYLQFKSGQAMVLGYGQNIWTASTGPQNVLYLDATIVSASKPLVAGSSLQVVGTTTLQSDLTAQTNAIVSGNLTVSTNINVSGEINSNKYPTYVYYCSGVTMATNTDFCDLFNAAGSGKIVRVTKVYAYTRNSGAITGVSQPLEIYRTSAVGAAGTTVTAGKFDTDDADPPAQVTFRRLPTNGVAIYAPSSPVAGADLYTEEGNNGQTQSIIYELDYSAGLNRALTLREGQGIKVRSGLVGAAGVFSIIVEVILI